MAITENDIKLLKSARMTDTPDGGGRMTGNVVQSGVDNNIFDDVSNLDRVYGNVSLRKVFPSVLTNTTDKYLGARVIIDEPPADPNVHTLLFDASSLFDIRDAARVKVEGYLSRGVAAQYRLYGDHIAGQASIALASQPQIPAPNVGDVLVLARKIDSSNSIEQFVRVTSASSVVLQFGVGAGGNAAASYTLRIDTCELSDRLRNDYLGWGPHPDGVVTQDDMVAPLNVLKTQLYQSVVANAAQYYGIRPLAQEAKADDFSVRADSAYSPLLPSAQIETPISDARTNGVLSSFVPGGGPVVLTTLAPTPTAKTYIGSAIMPGSLTGTAGSIVVADNGAGVLTFGGSDVGAVDYANGIVTASVDVFGGRVACVFAYTPAASASLVTQSIGVTVTTNSRALSFAHTLPSTPALRSLSISYMAGGRWYVLSDTGAGAATGSTALRGVDAGYGAGVFNFATRTMTITFGALPDVGSRIIVAWAEAARAEAATAYPLLAGGRMFCPLNTSGVASTERGAATLPPNGVSLSWNDGVARSATDNGAGALTGDAAGTVDYQAGVILWSPETMPAKGTVVTIDAAKKTSTSLTVAATGWGTSSLAIPFGQEIEPFSLRFTATCIFSIHSPVFTFPSGDGPGAGEFHAYQDVSGSDGLFTFTTVSDISQQANVTFSDNGVGGLLATVSSGGITLSIGPAGTVNYATGLIDVGAISPLQAGGLAFNLPIMRMLETHLPTYTGGFIFGDPGPVWIPSFVRLAKARVTGASVGCSYITGGSHTVQVVASSSPISSSTPLSVAVPAFLAAMEYVPTGKTLSHVSFKLGQNAFTSGASGTLVRNVDPTTGSGTDVGAVSAVTGAVTLSTWVPGTPTTVTDFRAALLPVLAGTDADFGNSRVTFHTAVAPLRPASLQLLGSMSDDASINVVAGADGVINGPRVKGRFDVSTGVCDLVFCSPTPTALGTIDLSGWGIPGVGVVNADEARVETLRYNAVAYAYLPLDADILGLDPVRLPSDGRVPIFKSGRVVVIHNTVKRSPQTVNNGTTVDCGRTRLARIRVFGNDGLEITSGFAKNLDAGTITFTNVSGYSQPVVIEHRIEDEALCAEAQITGDLRLARRLTHDFPADTSYVSSALVKGTLQAAARDTFAQETWTNVWSDARIGDPVLAAYDDTTYPIAVTNAGAITERWLVRFTSNTTFDLIGSEVGVIGSGSTVGTLSPVNPATGVPYFVLRASGWGSGWVAGNCLRFNTAGANFPLWVSRTVMQSPSAAPGTDQMTISIRGDIDQ